MKHLKTFEAIDLKFETKKFKISDNNGRIIFLFYNEDTKTYCDKRSMMLGSSKILDTIYFNNPIIRKIELKNNEFKHLSTVYAIIKVFLSKMGYAENLDNDTINTMEKFGNYKFTEYFFNKIKDASENSKTLGDVLDKLKILYSEFEKSVNLAKHAKKYNII